MATKKLLSTSIISFNCKLNLKKKSFRRTVFDHLTIEDHILLYWFCASAASCTYT